MRSPAMSPVCQRHLHRLSLEMITFWMSTQRRKYHNGLEGNSNLRMHFPQQDLNSLHQSILQCSGENTGNSFPCPTNSNCNKTGMMADHRQAAALWREFTPEENLDLKLSEADDCLCSLLVSLAHPPFPPSPLSLSLSLSLSLCFSDIMGHIQAYLLLCLIGD